jgi:hypothetical protein
MKRFPLLAAAWAALLVLGFAVVIVLGAPLPSAADELQSALQPATPVDQAAAERSAATIVRLEYPSFTSSPHTVTKATDFGVEHWVVEYSDTTSPSPRGVRVSIVLASGHVEVSAFP